MNKVSKVASKVITKLLEQPLGPKEDVDNNVQHCFCWHPTYSHIGTEDLQSFSILESIVDHQLDSDPKLGSKYTLEKIKVLQSPDNDLFLHLTLTTGRQIGP